ncbi:nucleophile aminohydrolase [Trametes meyenii]|nr:nucleophile aminohydrolase [Trametes meyenii]
MENIALDEEFCRVVAVHGGAGFHQHSSSADAEIKRVLRSACMRTAGVLNRKVAALEAVVEAIVILEDEECLNAGLGSNLTMDGTVECDASIIDGSTGDFGALGAVSGVKNPIRAANEVLQYSRDPDPLGRIPPLLLVSSGAEEFARGRGLTAQPASNMISARAREEWKKWKERLEAAGTTLPGGDRQLSTPNVVHSQQNDGIHDRQDTVGAVVLGTNGDLAAGVSSGGLLLKHSGRVGEAAIYGAGCWATTNTACSVSGAGEYITRASLARTICEAIEADGEDGDTHEVLQRVIGKQFYQLCSKRGEHPPQAGILLLVKEHDGENQLKPRLWCAFTTESMAVGYASTFSPKPIAIILRRPAPAPGDRASVYITALPLAR